MKKIKKLLDKLHLPTWLLIVLTAILILRIPSFFEPYSYGDETIYLTLGESVRQGKVLYRDIHDNKPPLLYITAAIAGSLFWFKAIFAFWMLATTVIFWKFTQVLFPKKDKLQKVSTIVFGLLTTMPLLEGNIANAEVFMIGPTLLAFYLLFTKKLTFKNLFISGLLFSVSTLFKVPAFFDVPVIVFFWLIIGGLKLKNIKKVAKNTVFIASGYLLPIFLTFVWYYFRGGFQEYLIAAFAQNMGYLSSFRPGDVVEPFLVRNAPLLVRGVLTLIGVGGVFAFRKKLSKQFIFLTIWLFFTLFAVTLSERPYPHYLIQSVPAISIMLGMFFTIKNAEQSFVVLPLAITLFIPVYYKFWYYPTGSYYTKFVKFATGEMTKNEYFLTFGKHIPRSYKIADFLTKSTKKDDSVFVWGGENQTVYALARRLPPTRYVAQYHINDFSNNKAVSEKIKKTPPEMIVLLPNAPNFSETTTFLKKNYILIQEIDGAEIWSLISPELKQKIAP